MLFDKYTDSIDNHVQIKIKHLKNQVNERVNIGLELMNLLDDPNATDIIDEIHRQAESNTIESRNAVVTKKRLSLLPE